MDRLLICAGAAKAGTTWLYSNLKSHPNLYFSPEKEIHFFYSKHGAFNRLTYGIRLSQFKKFANRSGTMKYSEMRNILDWYAQYLSGPIDDIWYRRVFAGATNEQYCCDFSPSTSLIPRSGWEHVRSSAEDIKVIYMMRNPLQRLWSHIKFHMTFIGEFDKLAEFSEKDYSDTIDRYLLMGDGAYGENYRKMIEVLPKSNVLVCFMDDVINRPAWLLEEIEDFIGISKQCYPPTVEAKVNSSKTLGMPTFLGKRYAPEMHRQMDILEELGVKAPENWRDIG